MDASRPVKTDWAYNALLYAPIIAIGAYAASTMAQSNFSVDSGGNETISGTLTINSMASMNGGVTITPAAPVSGDLFFGDNNGGVQYATGTRVDNLGGLYSTTLSASLVGLPFSYPSRSLNSCFQVSATKNALVNYSVDINTSLSLTGGSTGTVALDEFTNSGCTTGTQEIAHYTNGNTGTLTIGLALSQIGTAQLSGMVPAGNWLKLITTNVTGTPTYGTPIAEEVLF